ncbi:MAG: mitochondrial fission ELM1 family protein [Candidatus Contendobacter sp.]|nr:mitochondrial fission ELM1 family protein [Candidatus Contendobacter sp.]MDG4556578.1 mitochondrial fission ELM1 family protein [Candidatus Contendobacter sp.]
MSFVVWRFCDGKAGHDNQTRGLAEALARLRSVEVVTLEPLSPVAALRGLLLGCQPGWNACPTPNLLLGAGHRTHLSLLAARRIRGGKAVVLMRPSLPLGLFDLCLIPEHDAPPVRPNVLVTRGALNRIRPAALNPHRGLLLIGGPSAHFGWDNAALRQAIATLVAANPAIQWTLTTSRRTPPDFLEGLAGMADARLTVVPVAATGPDWLPAQLARTGQAWVTADSVSMVYEALTAGAMVGVLEVPRKRASRIGKGLDGLIADGWVTSFLNWQGGARLRRPPGNFNEAERCARWIVEQWLG